MWLLFHSGKNGSICDVLLGLEIVCLPRVPCLIILMFALEIRVRANKRQGQDSNQVPQSQSQQSRECAFLFGQRRSLGVYDFKHLSQKSVLASDRYQGCHQPSWSSTGYKTELITSCLCPGGRAVGKQYRSKHTFVRYPIPDPGPCTKKTHSTWHLNTYWQSHTQYDGLHISATISLVSDSMHLSFQNPSHNTIPRLSTSSSVSL